jgi:hypothetical protein
MQAGLIATIMSPASSLFLFSQASSWRMVARWRTTISRRSLPFTWSSGQLYVLHGAMALAVVEARCLCLV